MFIKELAFYVMKTMRLFTQHLETSTWVGGQAVITLTADYSCLVQEVLSFAMWLGLHKLGSLISKKLSREKLHVWWNSVEHAFNLGWPRELSRMGSFLWMAVRNSDSSISLLHAPLIKPLQRTLEHYLQYYYSHVSPRAKRNVVFIGQFPSALGLS